MRRKETQARPDSGPIPVTALCTLSSAVLCVALEPVQLQVVPLSFAFLSQDFLQGSHPSCSAPQGFSSACVAPGRDTAL